MNLTTKANRRFVWTVIQGVVSGLIVTGMLGFYQWVNTNRLEHVQIERLREIAIHRYIAIKSPYLLFRLVYPPPVRFSIFKTFVEDLDIALDYRSPNIGHEKRYELELVITEARKLIEKREKDTGPVDSIIIYNPTFFRLVGMEWLGIEYADLGIDYADTESRGKAKGTRGIPNVFL